MAISIAEIKEFNAEVVRYKEELQSVGNEVELNRRDIKRLCDELTERLGYEVSEKNIEQVYKQMLKEVEQDMEAGKAILTRIQSEKDMDEMEDESLDVDLGEEEEEEYTQTIKADMPDDEEENIIISLGDEDDDDDGDIDNEGEVEAPFGDMPPLFQRGTRTGRIEI